MMAYSDSEIPPHLKQKARRRLIGAVIFVFLASIILLAVMDADPQSSGSEPLISIPAKPGEDAILLELNTLPVPEQAEQKDTAAVSLPPPAITTPDSATVAARPQPAAQNTQPPPPAKTMPAPPPSARQKPSEPPLRDLDAERAAAILAGRTPGAAAASNSTPHIILIGAYSDLSNVNTLKKKLGELGIPVYTETLEKEKKTRVRAGPFRNREEAERAQKKMERINLQGTKIASAPEKA
ncbi:MAG: SPOR domain-containing protein [Zoogloeaceae bacterium]|nr:SPOR domain-containing protein [Zoogloeaceae bacterium]